MVIFVLHATFPHTDDAFQSCVNLIFGYSRHLPATRGDSPTSTTPTDIATYVVDRALRSLSIELDVAILSRMVGLALLGTIIMVNMRAVLAWGSRIFKVTSTGLSSSFMLLALAQLMVRFHLMGFLLHADEAF